MLLKLKQQINKYCQRRNEEKQYASFLRYTNTALQDNINNLPRPEKSLLRILGNGDSLKSVVDTMSHECDYMVMNSHVLHHSYQELKPRYYVLADPAFFHPNACYDGTEILRRIFEKTKWKMTLFVSWEHTRDVEFPPSEWVSILRVNQCSYRGPEQYREYLYEHNLAMPEVNNVLASAIYLAIYMGYHEVEMYGVEHSWTKDIYVNDKNQTCIRDSHFYDKKEAQDNVIINEYQRPLRFHEVLRMYAVYFPAYWELRELADKHHCQIYNCTPNSFIDAFDRKKT